MSIRIDLELPREPSAIASINEAKTRVSGMWDASSKTDAILRVSATDVVRYCIAESNLDALQFAIDAAHAEHAATADKKAKTAVGRRWQLVRAQFQNAATREDYALSFPAITTMKGELTLIPRSEANAKKKAEQEQAQKESERALAEHQHRQEQQKLAELRELSAADIAAQVLELCGIAGVSVADVVGELAADWTDADFRATVNMVQKRRTEQTQQETATKKAA